jgi:microcystin-dependent protein
VNGSSSAADAAVPTGNLLGAVDNATFGNAYGGPSNLVAFSPQAVGNVGGSQAHLNQQPFLTLSFSIALQGIFPTPT